MGCENYKQILISMVIMFYFFFFFWMLRSHYQAELTQRMYDEKKPKILSGSL